VEKAWEMKISQNLIEYDHDDKVLFLKRSDRRVDVTSCRDALNGYQKGKCFYSFADISIEPRSENLADVDHFFSFLTCSKTSLTPINELGAISLMARTLFEAIELEDQLVQLSLFE